MFCNRHSEYEMIKITNFISLISNFYIFSRHFSIGWHTERKIRSKSIQIQKICARNDSTYYNVRCGIIIMLHRAREIRVERAKTKRSCRIRKEGEHCWNHSNLWNCNFSHEFHRTRSNLSRNAAKETNPFPYSLGFSFYWQS